MGLSDFNMGEDPPEAQLRALGRWLLTTLRMAVLSPVNCTFAERIYLRSWWGRDDIKHLYSLLPALADLEQNGIAGAVGLIDGVEIRRGDAAYVRLWLGLKSLFFYEEENPDLTPVQRLEYRRQVFRRSQFPLDEEAEQRLAGTTEEPLAAYENELGYENDEQGDWETWDVVVHRFLQDVLQDPTRTISHYYTAKKWFRSMPHEIQVSDVFEPPTPSEVQQPLSRCADIEHTFAEGRDEDLLRFILDVLMGSSEEVTRATVEAWLEESAK